MILGSHLELDRCPHCKVDKPSLTLQWDCTTNSHSGNNPRKWRIYLCARCGGLTMTASSDSQLLITEMYPSQIGVDEAVPLKAKKYLEQALNSLHSPDGAIMLSGSAIDAMLKEKKYVEGSLYQRIEKAASDNLITSDMAKWAHEVRLETNDQRHADDNAQNATDAEAQKVVKFASALAEFLFVLPSKVSRGLKEAEGNKQAKS